jgi:uncharacterized membrane protein YfcA
MLQWVLGGLSGVLVGFVLGVVGGGGSILAVPLMLYVVGVGDPHVAIGTSALAVAVNAVSNLVIHARRGNVRWPCASVFALAGIAGAYLGSSLGKAFDGNRLLALFAVVMVIVGIAMLRRRNTLGFADARLGRGNARLGWAPPPAGFLASLALAEAFSSCPHWWPRRACR